MSHRILILDDDRDFNTLITDVYRQADYEVKSVLSPTKALREFEEEHYDLVVTDQRMPELKGTEFVRKVFAIRRETPIIVISGYLDNDTIRDLIQQGVSGIFVKPVNIFSVLKKTESLLEQSRSGSPLPPGHGARKQSADSDGAALPFPFHAFPCRAPKAVAFAKQAYQTREFKSKLLLIGDPGADCRAIAQDIHELRAVPGESFLQLTNRALSDPNLPERIRGLESEGSGSVLVFLPETETMAEADVASLFSLVRKEGPFDGLAIEVRCIFCVHHDLDELFDEGRIDEALYLFLGTNELRIPPLREISEDIVPLAKRYAEEARGGQVALTRAAEAFLARQKWPGNEKQLRAVITTAIIGTDGAVDAALLEEAYSGRRVAPKGRHPYELPLRDFLCEVRDDYLTALLEVSGENPGEVARSLDLPVSFMESLIESMGARN